MKRFWKIFISFLSLGSIVLLIFLLKSYPTEDIIEPLSKVKFLHIAILLGLSISYLILYTIRWKRILKLEGCQIPFWRLLSLRFAGYSFSYTTPFSNYGGEPVMAYLLHREKPEFGFSKSFASVIAARIISAIPETFFLIVALFYTLFFFVFPGENVFAFYIPLGLVVGLVLLLYILLFKQNRPFTRAIRFLYLDRIPAIKKKIAEIKKFDSLLENVFQKNRREFFINLGISFINICSGILMFWLLAEFLGLGMNILDAAVLRSIASVVGSVIPVPANLGIGEGGTSAWFAILGLGAAQGLGFYLLIRGKDIILSLAGGVILLSKGVLKNLSQIKKKR